MPPPISPSPSPIPAAAFAGATSFADWQSVVDKGVLEAKFPAGSGSEPATLWLEFKSSPNSRALSCSIVNPANGFNRKATLSEPLPGSYAAVHGFMDGEINGIENALILRKGNNGEVSVAIQSQEAIRQLRLPSGSLGWSEPVRAAPSPPQETPGLGSRYGEDQFNTYMPQSESDRLGYPSTHSGYINNGLGGNLSAVQVSIRKFNDDGKITLQGGPTGEKTFHLRPGQHSVDGHSVCIGLPAVNLAGNVYAPVTVQKVWMDNSGTSHSGPLMKGVLLMQDSSPGGGVRWSEKLSTEGGVWRQVDVFMDPQGKPIGVGVAN